MTAPALAAPVQAARPAPLLPVRSEADELLRRRIASRDTAVAQLLLGALVDHVQPQELGTVVQAIRSGLRPFLVEPRVAPKLAKPLTERELAVLVGMSLGRGNRGIGSSMWITENTVKTTSQRMFRKLGVRDRAHAVARGYELGLLGGAA